MERKAAMKQNRVAFLARPAHRRVLPRSTSSSAGQVVLLDFLWQRCHGRSGARLEEGQRNFSWELCTWLSRRTCVMAGLVRYASAPGSFLTAMTDFVCRGGDSPAAAAGVHRCRE